MPDHDFPIPGYLLNVSGYVVLEEDKLVTNKDVMNPENWSMHDHNEMVTSENVERTCDLSNFIDMILKSVFPALINQFKVNFNIYPSAAELKGSLFEFIQNNFVDFHSHFENNKDDL